MFIGRACIVIAASLATGFWTDVGAQTQDWPCAFSGDHFWFVQRENREYALCHHAAAMDGPYFRKQIDLDSLPEAMAAWGDQVWLILSPDPTLVERRRLVSTGRIHFVGEAVGVYELVPSGLLESASTLDGTGQVAGFVGTAIGPMVLLTPPQWSDSTVVGGPGAAAAEPSLRSPRLLQLRNDQWIELDLPRNLTGRSECLIASTGEEGLSIVILEPHTAAPNAARQFLRDHTTGAWTETTIAQDLRGVRLIHGIGNQIIVALQPPTDSDLQIALLRPGSVMPLTRLQRPDGPYSIGELSGQLCLADRTSDGHVGLRRISLPLGTIQPREDLVPQSFGGRLWHALLVTAIVGSALLLVFLVRPTRQSALALPNGFELLGLEARAAAFIVDLLPGAVATLLLLDARPADLLRPPSMTLNLRESLPCLLMIAITIAHGTLSEVFFSSTLGKRLFGARVTAPDGAPVSPHRLMIRNALKLIVMLVPPLVLVVFLNSCRQGLGDILAGTVITRRSDSQHDSAGDGTHRGP